MRNILVFTLVVFLTATVGCRSLGARYLEGDWVSISMSENYLRDDPRGAHNFRKHKGVEHLYDNLLSRLNRYHIRHRLKFDVLIVDFYTGPGRERLVVDVIVREDGATVDQFEIEETTILHPKIKRLTRGMAKKITKRVRRL